MTEKTIRSINVTISVKMPIEHAYTAQEILDLLKIKSVYKEIKVYNTELITTEN
jgi:hypothetical protein